MPLYDYRCSHCGNIVEVRHSFGETHGEPCPACGSALVRVFNPAPIVFKGSGFYVTDSRKSAEARSAAKPAEAKPGDAKPADAKAGDAKTTDAAADGAAKTKSPESPTAPKATAPPIGESAA